MDLKLLHVLLMCSVVIASESSCDNDEVVTALDAKYFKFHNGFFFIHGLTNGESVVMYKTPDLNQIFIQYTHINDDCDYETRRYDIVEKGALTYTINRDDKVAFSIRETLSFNLHGFSGLFSEGKDVEIKFEINTKGFVLLEVFNETVIETFEVKVPTYNPGHGAMGVLSNDVSAFEFVHKDSLELTDMKNGRYFYQNYTDTNLIKGSYTFKTSSEDYYTMDYEIENSFKDNPSINLKNYEVKDSLSFFKAILFKVKFEGAIKKLVYVFESMGLSIAENFSAWLSAGAKAPTHQGSMKN